MAVTCGPRFPYDVETPFQSMESCHEFDIFSGSGTGIVYPPYDHPSHLAVSDHGLFLRGMGRTGRK